MNELPLETLEEKPAAVFPAPPLLDEAPGEADSTLTSRQKIMRRVGWGVFAFFTLIVFTLMKLPEDRVKAYIDGNISALLAPRGISYSAGDSSLSVLFGITYTLKDVTLTFPPPSPQARIDQIEISPSFLSLLIGKFGGSLWIKAGNGTLSSSFSVKNPEASLSFKAKKLDLGRLGLIPALLGVRGSGLLEGTASLSGNMLIPSTVEGAVDLRLTQVAMDPQSIEGFAVPRLALSEVIANLEISRAKATIKTLRIGKQGNAADDIQGVLTGEITLTKLWEMSNLNLKAHFGFSENVMKSFALLDMLLASGKQADGTFAFSLTGPLASPIPTPIGATGN